jgi:acyl carrier protein
MLDAELEQVVADAIRAVSPAARAATFHSQTKLLAELGLDSLDLVAVILRVQDRFAIEIDLDEVPSLERVGDISSCVSRHLAFAA